MKTILTFLAMSWACLVQAQFVIFSNVEQRNITPTSFSLNYTTNNAGIGVVKYGLTTSLEMGLQGTGSSATSHSIGISGLQAATFYYARVGLVQGVDTAWANTTYYSTASTSSGLIKVFFNENIYTPISSGSFPQIYNSGTNILNELVKYIDSARSTIDIAVYNNDQSTIVNALRRAQQRGVQVRYIADQGTSNTALSGTLPFPVIYLNNDNFMHNKFMIVDADSAQRAVLWTGSMNWTTGNIFDDPNNVVVFHDQSLAKAYRIEFEEMWGSNGAQPGPSSNQRFAATKVDNTPHFFQVGGVPVEVYFSPSDRTTSKIVSALNSANNDIEFALLTLTRSDIANAITNAHRRGVQVRGIIENINDQSSRFQPLVDSGVSVVGDNQNWQLHHKYGIVDAAGGSNGRPIVITGSHNWSTSAETLNDENTLLIYNATIANLFLQEFARRWCDVQGGVCQFTIGVEELATQSLNPRLLPNPVSSQGRLLLNMGQQGAKLQGRLSNALGQEVKTWQWGWLQGEQQLDLDLSDLPTGIYYLSLPTRLGVEVLTIQKQ